MVYSLHMILFCRNLDTLQEGGGPGFADRVRTGQKKVRPTPDESCHIISPPRFGSLGLSIWFTVGLGVDWL